MEKGFDYGFEYAAPTMTVVKWPKMGFASLHGIKPSNKEMMMMTNGQNMRSSSPEEVHYLHQGHPTIIRPGTTQGLYVPDATDTVTRL